MKKELGNFGFGKEVGKGRSFTAKCIFGLRQGKYGLTLFDPHGNYVGRVTLFGSPWPLAILIIPGRLSLVYFGLVGSFCFPRFIFILFYISI